MTQAVWFLITVFAATWTASVLWRPPAAPESLWGAIAPLLPWAWTPTIVALVLTRSIEGADGLRRELRARFGYPRGSVRWLVVAAVVPVLAVAAAVFAARRAGDSLPIMPVEAVLPMIGVQLVTGAVGEELGWRGYLLPRLRVRWGATAAGWIMAVLWSLWHTVAWLDPNLPYRTMPLVWTLLALAGFGVFLAFIFSRARESVLPTMVAHVSLNVMLGLGGVPLSSVPFWRTLALIFGTLALVATVAARVPSSITSPAVPQNR